MVKYKYSTMLFFNQPQHFKEISEGNERKQLNKNAIREQYPWLKK